MDPETFLIKLREMNALKFGDFTLASGKSSKFYLDLRLIPSYPRLFKKIGDLLIKKCRTLDFDIVVGIPTAGVPFATYISIFCEKPLIYLRKEIKSHGTKKKLEGIKVDNKRVLLVDDLISSGFSKEFAIQNIRSERGIVEEILVLVDRREKNETNNNWEEANKVNVVSLFQFSADKLLQFANNNNLL
ncbi:MAG: Orotate phosphoribosyltransferase [Candidatus Heimdallarchaeota archaeon LC_3]|nr:MAG: Orotate phosphoribosyltransferase [Candidatus Heimdallarchaeota archaeon LC_3]